MHGYSAPHPCAVYAAISICRLWCSNGSGCGCGWTSHTAFRYTHGFTIDHRARRHGGESGAHGQCGDYDQAFHDVLCVRLTSIGGQAGGSEEAGRLSILQPPFPAESTSVLAWKPSGSVFCLGTPWPPRSSLDHQAWGVSWTAVVGGEPTRTAVTCLGPCVLAPGS